MFKEALVIVTLLTGIMTFPASAKDKQILEHISISAIAATPTMLEEAIAKIANKNNASSWEITSMRFDDNSTATAVLYK
ncbi:TPA: DUF1471 domain-containing protein [Escherichia coli]|uniref:reactive chlorine resistance periplasmic protein RclB n=1 Tax=Escherichia coli TaxID=562 RepID=UPI000BE187BC|nr:reactive chlorine resistance periplasmic protein RclB [Escherichia coli]HAL5940633.1 DUF1471 domain-containing protein [Escherichia coli]